MGKVYVGKGTVPVSDNQKMRRPIVGNVYNGTGTASKDGTIRLDDPAGLPSGRVRVTVEADVPGTEESFADVPPAPGAGKSARQILRELRALRDEWDDTTSGPPTPSTSRAR